MLFTNFSQMANQKQQKQDRESGGSSRSTNHINDQPRQPRFGGSSLKEYRKDENENGTNRKPRSHSHEIAGMFNFYSNNNTFSRFQGRSDYSSQKIKDPASDGKRKLK